LKRYRVCLIEERPGDEELLAENAREAEKKAMRSANVDWSCQGNTNLCNVVEIDEDG
jgi:hypothetical protein